MSAPWLIALDLDGTLFDHSLTISPRVRRAIAATQQSGHAVTLATGRMYRAARPFATDLKLDHPLICYQGALIRSERETLSHRTLPLAIAREVVAMADSQNIAANIYLDDRLFVAEHREENAFYGSLSPGVEIEAVGSLLDFMDEPPTKIVLIQQEEEVAQLLERVTERWGEEAQVVRSHARFVELTHLEASKGDALRQLAGLLGIPMARTMAVGDNLNDLSMVRAAALGVAMGNADPQLKAAADWVAPLLGEEGLAVALERFVIDETQACVGA